MEQSVAPPSGIVAQTAAPKPGPGRRAFGWLLIILSPVPAIVPFVALFQTWDQLGQSNTPLWVLPLVMLCYVAFGAAFLWVGRGLVSGQDKFIWNGMFLLFGTVAAFVTLFGIFD